MILNSADLGGRAHVRAAAQLARVLAVADLAPCARRRRTSRRTAPSRRAPCASSSVVVIGRTGSLRGDPLVDAVLDVAQLLVGQAAAPWREVEAQLVRPDVGARLAHVGAQPLAQRRVQQVRRRVVGLGRVARARGRRGASTRSPGFSSPASSSTTTAWSSPRRNTSSTARGSRRPRTRSSRRRRPGRRRARRTATRRA